VPYPTVSIAGRPGDLHVRAWLQAASALSASLSDQAWNVSSDPRLAQGRSQT